MNGGPIQYRRFLSVKHYQRNGNKVESRSANGKTARFSVKQNVCYFIQVAHIAGSFQGVKVKQMYWESSRR
jgi:hypothetical protein